MRSRFAQAYCCRVAVIAACGTLEGGVATAQPPLHLLQPDGAVGDQFGRAIAIDGDTMIIGAFRDTVSGRLAQGSAHVFRWNGAAWVYEAALTASDGAADDHFGVSVDIDGDTAVVGAFRDDTDGRTEQGSAYVFVRTGSAWMQQAKLTASDGAAGDELGVSVAIEGDTIVAGAFTVDVGPNPDQGAAYVFERSGTTWTQQARLIITDGAEGDGLGISVAIDSQQILVGAYGARVEGMPDHGAAYVFVRSGAAWLLLSPLVASGGASGDLFGSSVAISGNTAIIGAPGADVGASVDQGAAYVFVRLGDAWVQQARLVVPGGAPGDSAGSSVAIHGDAAIVGAMRDDIGVQPDAGSAHYFARSNSVWAHRTVLLAPDAEAFDNAGISCAIEGDTVAIGAFGDNIGQQANQGSVWMFRISPPVPCDPDINCDGSVDGFDVEVMEQAVGGDSTNFCLADADFNRDGSVDGFDVESVETVVGGGACP